MAAIQQVLLGVMRRVFSWLNWEVENNITSPTWSSVAIDSTGTNAVASTITGGGGVYVTNDSGQSWKLSPFGTLPASGFSLAMSSDGSRILGCAGSTQIKYSTDYGVTVNSFGSISINWTDCCMSDDASIIMLCGSGTAIYITSSTFSSFQVRDGIRAWSNIACSFNGVYGIACVLGEFIYVSSDSGMTWTPKINDTARNWRSVACSQDGSIQFAAADNNNVFYSVDFGVTWIESTSGTVFAATAVSCSSYGETVVFAGKSGAGSGFIARGIKSGASSFSWNTLFVGGAGVNDVACSGSGNFTLLGRDTSPLYIFNTFQYSSGVTASPPRRWVCTASDTSGTIIYAVNSTDKVYKSTNGGLGWIEVGTISGFKKICCSANGTVVAAITLNDQIVVSTNSGSSWTVRDSARSWQDIACSSTGANMVACVSNGQIYTSTNSGTSWIARDSARNWTAVSCSSSGSIQVAAVLRGLIYTSSDYGQTWTARGSINREWTSLDSSDDGVTVIATVNLNSVYVSTNSGVSMGPVVTGTRNWVSSSISGDGRSMMACAAGLNLVYFSRDRGRTWASTDLGINSTTWSCIQLSRDSRKVFVGQLDGQLYTNTI